MNKNMTKIILDVIMTVILIVLMNVSGTNNNAALEDGTTLEDYLGNLYCTACHKHCPMSSPRCMRGVDQADQATETYNSMVGQLQLQKEAEKQTADNETTAGKAGTATESSDGYGEKNLAASFSDFTPVMTLYAAGAYYIVSFTDK